MNYQLPNGKVIYISIEEYLALTDADIQYLIALDYGEVLRGADVQPAVWCFPWQRSHRRLLEL